MDLVNGRNLYSCALCGAVFASPKSCCPVCVPVRIPATSGYVIQHPIYDAMHPHDGGYDPKTGQTFVGIRGSCDFCVCTSPRHTINGMRYCKACFDKKYTLIEKPVEGMGSAK